MSFYSNEELHEIGFKNFGHNVLISKKASIYNPEAISIGNHVRIDDFCVLSGGSEISLGNYIHIACFSALYGSYGIVMEDFSTLGSRGAIHSASDDFSGKSMTNPMIPEEFKPHLYKKRVSIGKHVIIGGCCTLLPGSDLEEGSAITAHSMVMGRCTPWTYYSGVPAVKIKERSKEILNLEKEFLEWERNEN